MSSSLRRFIGMIMLVSFVLIYCFIVMVIGDLTLYESHWAVKLTYFAITGLIWIFPAHRIIMWAYKEL